MELAEGLTTEDALRAFFEKRQPGAGSHLKIKVAWRVVNDQRLKAFKKAGGFELNTHQAKAKQCDTMLFHGCAPDVATNVQAVGLLLKYARGGNLGVGLYGAPDPRKSLQFCKNSQDGKFMFVCRFNLRQAKRAGPNTNHRNTIFDEFCVYDDRHVVVLWMIKLA